MMINMGQFLQMAKNAQQPMQPNEGVSSFQLILSEQTEDLLITEGTPFLDSYKGGNEAGNAWTVVDELLTANQVDELPHGTLMVSETELPADMADALGELLQEHGIQVEIPEQEVSLSLNNPIPSNTGKVEMDSGLLKELREMQSTFTSIASSLESGSSLRKAAAEVMALLQRWTALEKNHGDLTHKLTDTGAQKQEQPTLWSELLRTFQKRDGMAGKQLYGNEAKVTNADVAKWLGKLINAKESPVRTETAQAITGANLPITKLEQYVIHIQHSPESKSAEQQLLEEFQKVIKASSFTAQTNNQMVMTIRPDTLGEMTLKFTQVNGEMMVKILVTSQSAKEMLESNMGQLRTMFSPHQVAVEKQDVSIQSQQDVQEDLAGDHPPEQDNDYPNNDEDGDSDTEMDFAEKMEEIMNEKV
ncbi:flagellar hook-length control protein FliK [Virgibacillus sediminis]|uniref:Flagellar hook-length control protein FliK n=1 Tax=Virgibacillus sediminis TaxID=202260 RepID=A0ABV7AAX5_9BACI